MFGPLGKYLLLILVALAAWYGYKYVVRVGQVRQDEARRRTRGPQGAAPGSVAAQDMTKCAACGAYVTPGAGKCGRADCPFPA
jgi:hypothetical protein